MQPLLDSFSALKDEFPSESSILTAIDHEIQEIQDWIVEKTDDDSRKDRPSRTFGDVEGTQDRPPVQLRGIFDDLDE